MKSIKESAEEYEHEHVGIKAVHVRTTYLAGARYALEMAAQIAKAGKVRLYPKDDRAIQSHNFACDDIEKQIRNLIPE